jgi:DNA-binding MarR family transcriptional regulator
LPAAPQTLEEIGLSPNFLQELALKVVHYSEQPMATHLARTMGLPTVHVSEILNTLRRDNLVEVVSSADYSSERDFRYRLTDKGEARAERALDRCRYAGPAPVTLTQYERIFSSTVSPDWRPSKASVRNAIESLVLDEAVIDRLTKALRSGRATMVFGSTGNGKSHILSSFIDAMEGEVLVPYSIYAHGQIIRVFDPKIHDRIPERDEEAERQPAEPGLARRQSSFEHHDRRWVRIKRPGVIVGGEIGPESLELGYDPVTRFYQAPAHFKAQGGVFVVDDFGRQKVTPAEIMNRWIMSLERGRDQLLLRTGEALDVPFHVTILFSTNLNPGDLTDSAYLRRIPYKVYIPSVRRDQFTEILRRACHQYSVHYDAENIEGAVSFIERVLNGRLYGSLSRDLIGILAENFRQEGAEPVLSAEAIRLAYQQFTGVADSLERGFRSAWAEEDAEMDAFVA